MTYDAVVIGGGLIGMTTARSLRIAGLKVALLEKNRLGEESSWAAGGILARFYPWRQSEGARMLIEASQAAFPEFVAQLQEETGVDPQLLHCGILVADMEEQDQALAWARTCDTQIEPINQDRLQALEPNLAQHLQGALHIPSAMQVQPRLLAKALRKSLVLHGVEIFENTEVTDLQARDRVITGVSTHQRAFHANQVVVCNGAWAQQLLKTLSDVCTDIVPVRGQILLLKTRQRLLSNILVQNEQYMIPRKKPYILCGSTLEYVGFDRAVTEEAKEALRAWACQLCPQLQDAELADHWSGLRPGTLREAPYICVHPEYENLYLNAGHFRWGIAMSLASADLARELMTNPSEAQPMVQYGWD